MDAPQAHAFVALRLDTVNGPDFGSHEVEQLLNETAITTDSEGVEPDETGWVTTYSVSGCYRVLAEAWGIKAGRAAHRFDFTAPTSGGIFKVSQIQDHCEAQAAKFRALANRSVLTADAV